MDLSILIAEGRGPNPLFSLEQRKLAVSPYLAGGLEEVFLRNLVNS